jgi:hypothetical protein
MEVAGLSRFKVFLVLTTIIVILIQLVWINIKDYDPHIQSRAIGASTSMVAKFAATCKLNNDNYVDSGATSDESPFDPMSSLRNRPWLVSPAFSALVLLACDDQKNPLNRLVIWAKWCLMATAFLSVLTARFLTSSWLISLLTGAAILGRSTFLDRLPELAVDGYLGLAFSLWLACSAHFIRTGSVIMVLVAALAIFIGGLFDPSFLALGFAMPVLLLGGSLVRKRLAAPVFKRLRQERRRQEQLRRSMSYRGSVKTRIWPDFKSRLRSLLRKGLPREPILDLRRGLQRGGLFQTIDVPFAIWAYHESRWFKLAVGWIMTSLAFALFYVMIIGWYLYPAAIEPSLAKFFEFAFRLESFDWFWFDQWVGHNINTIDLYYGLSLVIVLFCGIQSPADGLLSFLEAAWLLAIGCCLCFVSCLFLDYVEWNLLFHNLPSLDHARDLSQLLVRSPARWIEAGLLTFGICGVYNLIKVIDSRLGQKNP